jgi:hypothetical protein
MVPARAGDGCWSIDTQAESGALVSKFIGPTPTAEFSRFLEALTVRLPEAPAKLVFDLREINGYNPDTKAPMKDWLLTHKASIDELVVVVPRALLALKMATAAVGLAVGVRITIQEAASYVE